MFNSTLLLRSMAFLAAPALLVANVAARADALQDVASVTVRYQDLNLNTDQGAANLYRRIHVAAAQVCAQQESAQLWNHSRWSACVDQAVTNAVHAVHSESLSAYAWQHGTPALRSDGRSTMVATH